MNRKILFFYTLEIGNINNIKEAPDQFFQLLLSINSIRKVFGNDDLIQIYTDNPEFIKNVLEHPYFKNINKNIEIIKGNEEKFLYSGPYGKKYGHARMILLPELVKEYKNYTVIYLDPDTGIRKNSEKFRKYILYPLSVFLYRPEPHNLFNFFHSGGKLIDFWPKFYKEYNIPDKSYCINNGVIIVPNYNFYYQIKEAKELYYDIYNKLKYLILINNLNIRDLFFADMFSCSIAFYRFKWKYLYPIQFFNIKIKGNIPGDPKNIPIIHYYNEKYSNNSFWRKEKEKIIKIISC